MRAPIGLLLLVLAACATEEAAAPPTAPAVAAVPPAVPAPATRPARRPGADRPAQWRVAEDGTTGCADRATLQRLREPVEPGAAGLRRLAALRAAGGCVTVFRAVPLRLVETGAEILRLEPVVAEGPSRPTGPLYFWRDQVAEERGV
jgi:hypothetical protein